MTEQPETLLLTCPRCTERTLTLTLPQPPEQVLRQEGGEPVIVDLDVEQRCECPLSDDEIDAVYEGLMAGFLAEHARFHHEQDKPS